MTDCIKNLIIKIPCCRSTASIDAFLFFRASLETTPVGFLGIFTRGILGCDCGLAKNLHSSQNRGAVWSPEKANSICFQNMLSEFLSYLQ
jgi:hypothetical protein